MHRGWGHKNLKQEIQKSPVWLPTHSPSKNWDADCFPELGKKPDGTYVEEKL